MHFDNNNYYDSDSYMRLTLETKRCKVGKKWKWNFYGNRETFATLQKAFCYFQVFACVKSRFLRSKIFLICLKSNILMSYPRLGTLFSFKNIHKIRTITFTSIIIISLIKKFAMETARAHIHTGNFNYSVVVVGKVTNFLIWDCHV
jgi:hypothetical protein